MNFPEALLLVLFAVPGYLWFAAEEKFASESTAVVDKKAAVIWRSVVCFGLTAITAMYVFEDFRELSEVLLFEDMWLTGIAVCILSAVGIVIGLVAGVWRASASCSYLSVMLAKLVPGARTGLTPSPRVRAFAGVDSSYVQITMKSGEIFMAYAGPKFLISKQSEGDEVFFDVLYTPDGDGQLNVDESVNGLFINLTDVESMVLYDPKILATQSDSTTSQSCRDLISEHAFTETKQANCTSAKNHSAKIPIDQEVKLNEAKLLTMRRMP